LDPVREALELNATKMLAVISGAQQGEAHAAQRPVRALDEVGGKTAVLGRGKRCAMLNPHGENAAVLDRADVPA
jgi:hypothetical protein